MLFADEARKIAQNMPRRLSQSVIGRIKVDYSRWGRLGRETSSWLHDVNGDPKRGRTKLEMRKEIFNEDEGDAEVAAANVKVGVAEVKEILYAKVTIDPPSTGMPRTYLEGLSDIELRIANQISYGMKVASRWEVVGRHTGALLGRPATGGDVTVNGVTIVKFEETTDEEGNLAFNATEEWTCWDLPGVLEQIGVLP
jgi:hypothetical protein